MWKTTFELAQRNQLVLAKIRPIKWIDGGYEIGYIHRDSKLFSPQLSANAIDLDRVERWIAIDEIEGILSRTMDLPHRGSSKNHPIRPQSSLRPMREGIENYELGGES